VPSTALKLTPDQIDNLKQFGLDVGKGLVGETPSEWAFNAAMLPMGPVPRAAAMGASAMLRSSDSEANLARLATYVPARLQKLYELAKKLRETGEGSKIWQATEGKLTMGPEKHIEAIYRPESMAYEKLGSKPVTAFPDVAQSPDFLKDFPNMSQLQVKTAPIDGGLFRSRASEGPMATIGEKYKGSPFQSSSLLGHESQHGFDYLHGYTFGSSQTIENANIANFITELNKIPDRQLSTAAKIRAELLRERLGQKGADENLYNRNLGEARARGAGRVWSYPNDIDPYRSESVLKRFGLQEGDTLNIGEKAYNRIMNQASPVYNKDLTTVLDELKQTK